MSDRLKIALLLAPALLLVGGLFFGGLAVGVVRSLGVSPALGGAGPTLAAYRTLLADPEFLRSLALSLHISVISTALAAIIGVAAALLLRRTFVGRGVATVLFQLNLTVPHLVGAIGILYLLSQSGLVARAAHGAGLIGGPADFPPLTHDRWAIGIILVYVWKEVPFIGIVALAQMQALGEDWESVARGLGASRWQALRHVLLPLILPGVLAASVIVFAFTFGAYEIPALLGQSYPAALPVLAWRRFTDPDLAARPEAMATALVIALLSAAMIWAYVRLVRRGVRA
ncbi:ABC transporter permease [Wenxinia marina]|uniref:ABC-type sugar transport system, permease component n=1 Tax=Wenxinia marina DSM 24838 TaxID=1123501 RepID=A0A0D0QH83_9RHOB|nr:ABC transporter permease subunit [Wenxinia marina]KIQ70423.1 ABC-type sugar transport system, permease component [Wenxinia marina DSM 24838]GGL53304.1 ABC transporter [Wenxinia marina]